MAKKCTCRVLTNRYCPLHSKFAKEKIKQTYKVTDLLDKIAELKAEKAEFANIKQIAGEEIIKGMKDQATALKKIGRSVCSIAITSHASELYCQATRLETMMKGKSK